MSPPPPADPGAAPVPALRVAWEGCEPLPAAAPVPPEGASPGPAGLWRARFRLFNDGAAPVRVESAWLPHGRFRGPGGPVTQLDPSPVPLPIPPGGQAPLALDLAFHEAPGTVFENAFLILVVCAGSAPPDAGPEGAPGAGAQRQRIFARYTVEAGADGSPQPRLEALTAQAVGFAAGGAAGTPKAPADPVDPTGPVDPTDPAAPTDSTGRADSTGPADFGPERG